MVKECLVNTHTILFTCGIIFGSMYTVANSLAWSDYKDDKKVDCDVLLVRRVAEDFAYVVIFLQLILQAYMSAKFTAPATNSRKKFMLVYQNQPN